MDKKRKHDDLPSILVSNKKYNAENAVSDIALSRLMTVAAISHHVCDDIHHPDDLHPVGPPPVGPPPVGPPPPLRPLTQLSIKAKAYTKQAVQIPPDIFTKCASMVRFVVNGITFGDMADFDHYLLCHFSILHCKEEIDEFSRELVPKNMLEHWRKAADEDQENLGLEAIFLREIQVIIANNICFRAESRYASVVLSAETIEYISADVADEIITLLKLLPGKLLRAEIIEQHVEIESNFNCASDEAYKIYSERSRRIIAANQLKIVSWRLAGYDNLSTLTPAQQICCSDLATQSYLLEEEICLFSGSIPWESVD